MDVITQRRVLTAISGLLFLGAVAAIVWACADIDPHRLTQGRPVEPLAPPANSEFEPGVIGDRAITRPLRRPLYDPPPSPPRDRVPPSPRPAPTPPVTSLGVTLVGTVIDSGKSLAILADAAGKFDVKGIGESLELTPPGVTVESIEREQVTLRYQGRRSTIQLDRSKQKRDSENPNRGKNRRRNR